jgi:hypothetical protein
MREGRPNPVSECRVLRLFRFRPVRKGFDAVLRDELIPDLVAFPDLVDVYVGRQGPDEMGDRLVASVWASRAAMSSAVGDGFAPATFHPEHLDETTERILESHDLDVVLRFDPTDVVASPPAAGILRLVRGQVRPGELTTYRDQARLGTIADSEGGHGPLALYLALEEPDRFVTLSVWSSWSALEVATGGDVGRPIATRHEERLLAWEAAHYEILPNMGHPRSPAVT